MNSARMTIVILAIFFRLVKIDPPILLTQKLYEMRENAVRTEKRKWYAG